MESHNRKSNVNMLWGGLLLIIGAIFLMNEIMPWDFGALIPTTIMAGIGFTFFSVYLSDRSRAWALIPAYVFWAVGGIIFLAAVLEIDEQWVWAYIMFAMGFPFFYVYVRNRTNWWALIPAGIFASVGFGLVVGAVMPVIPVLMILGGIYLLVRNMAGGRRESAQPVVAVPQTGPEADKPRSS